MAARFSRRGCLLALPPVLFGLAGAGFLWPEAERRGSRLLDWYTDDLPPEVAILGPNGTVRGEMVISVVVGDPSGWEVASVTLDGRPLTTASGEHLIDTGKIPDGQHTVEVAAVDRSRLGNAARQEWVFASRNTGPQLALAPESTKVGQGQTLLVRVQANLPSTFEGSFDGRPLHWVQEGASAWALAGIDNMAKAGPRSLKLRATDDLGNQTEKDLTVTVDPVKYPNEYIWLPPSTSGLVASDVNTKEIARLDQLFAQVSPTKRWNGQFSRPVQAGIASDFATGRSYNGGPITGRHWGTDFDCFTGATVIAAAPGVIALVDTLAVRGRVVILDHGLGVFSCYYHLSRQDVRQGQEVKQGDRLGLSGETGAVTGPHLHWEMRVRGDAIDPMVWTRQGFPA